MKIHFCHDASTQTGFSRNTLQKKIVTSVLCWCVLLPMYGINKDETDAFGHEITQNLWENRQKEGYIVLLIFTCGFARRE